MEINAELIQRFFENNCTPEEKEAVLHYFSQHPEHVQRWLPFSEWETADNSQLPDGMSQEMLYKLRKRLFPVRSRAWLKAAAVLVPLAGVALFLFHKPQKPLASHAVAIAVHQPVRDTLFYDNHHDTAMAVLLPDGSHIRLSPGAKLKCLSAFGVTHRDVYLEGEAYFDVAKQSSRPFTVYTGAIRTKVLGTTFIINARKSSIAIKLFTGKIMVSSVKGDVYLLPGEQLSYNRMSEELQVAKKPVVIPEVAPEAITEDSVLHFNRASLSDVVEKLSSVYQTRIVYDRKLIAGMNFTGTVTHTDSLSVILRIIANMNDLEVQRNDSTFTLSKPK
jgi:transmembrane sensor